MILCNKKSVNLDRLNSFTDEELGKKFGCYCDTLLEVELGTVRIDDEFDARIIASSFIVTNLDQVAFEGYEKDQFVEFRVSISPHLPFEGDFNELKFSKVPDWVVERISKIGTRKFILAAENEKELGLRVKNAVNYCFSQINWEGFFHHQTITMADFIRLIPITYGVWEFRKPRKPSSFYPRYFDSLENM